MSLHNEFQDRDYRRVYAESFANTIIATQIRLLRGSLTQQEFADLVGIKQSRVSAMEDENYSAWSTKTLKRIAAGKDVVFLGRFFSFGELLNWSRAMSEDALRVPSFSNDPAFLGASAINSMQATTSGLNALAIGSSQTTVTPLATAHVATNQFSQASLPLMGLVRSNTSNTLPRALVIDAVA